MARWIYLADLPTGDVVSVVDNADYDQGGRKMPRIYTPETGWLRCTRVVRRKSNPSLHKCDSRCMYATGRTMQCECSCGGKNHGRGGIAPANQGQTVSREEAATAFNRLITGRAK